MCRCVSFVRAVCQMSKLADALNYTFPANKSPELVKCTRKLASAKSEAEYVTSHLPGISDLIFSSGREPKLKAG